MSQRGQPMEGSKGGGDVVVHRFPVVSEDVGDHVECSSRSCRSCSAVLIADCIALGCCPCAVVSLLGLTLVKAPFVMGRRWLGILRKRGRLLKRVRDVGEKGGEVVVGLDVKSVEMKGKEWGEVFGTERLSSEPDAERVWLELYQFGNWGFGRVSFSGNPGKGISGKTATE
ncbi:uncharacterized protein [Typha latifolia]|uniref:uncharacterized protein n=1 Tax=Typha latifolia TaxID=4733 RepID=UPI003C3087F3